MNRRDLLQLGALAAPLIIAGRAFAAPQTQQKLLVVFLRGAYDAANVVIPTSSDFYYAARGRPSRLRSRIRPIRSARLPLDADWSLHPALEGLDLPVCGRRSRLPSCPSRGPTT